MMTRFGVESYKCLKHVDIPLTPIHVLIGQNDAGKTSLLEAMYALYRSSEMPLNDAFSGEWTGRELVLETQKSRDVSLFANWEYQKDQEVKYRLRVEFDRQQKQCSVNGESLRVGNSQKHELGKPSDRTSVCQFRETGRLLSHVPPCIEVVADLLSGVQMYRLDPTQMAAPSPLNMPPTFCLERDGFGLASLLDEIQSHDVDLFIKVRNDFCRYLPQFRGVRLETVQTVRRNYDKSGSYRIAGKTTGKGVHLETKLGSSIRAQQVSDGAILFLGFLALTYVPEPPKLLLIEEPETGVYPKRLEEVIHLLKTFVGEHDQGKVPQVVMTTHSPYLLSFFEPEEVTFLRRVDSSTVRAYPLRDALNIRERMDGGTFNLGELWYNLTEEELFADA